MLPVAGKPVYKLFLEWLACAECVSDIIVVGAHEATTALAGILPTNTSLLHTAAGVSIGDMLREVDDAGIVSGDFILFRSGALDYVSNVSLDKLYSQHVANPHAIATCLITSTAEPEEMVLAITNSGTIAAVAPIDGPIEIPTTELILRADVRDAFVDICSQQVLSLLTENFDYQDWWMDLVAGTVSSPILSFKFGVSIIEPHAYIGTCRSPSEYLRVNRDVLQRWTYPLVPDLSAEYILRENSIYWTRQPGNVHPLARISGYSQIGPHASLGQNCIIINSILGQNCKVGANTRIEDSILFDNVVVEDACIISQGCIVGFEAKITNGALIGPFSIIGADAFVSVSLDGYSRVVASADHPTYPHPIESASVMIEDADQQYSGSREAVAWTHECSSEHQQNLRSSSQNSEMFEDLLTAEAFSLCPEPLMVQNTKLGSTDYFSLRMPSSTPSVQPVTKSWAKSFELDAIETLRYALRVADDSFEISLVENTLLEINALKFAYNVSFDQIRNVIVPPLIKHYCDSDTSVDKSASLLVRWAPLLSRLGYGENGQLAIMSLVYETCLTDAEKAFPWIVMRLYEHEVVSGDSILCWWHSQPNPNILLSTLSTFINWLEEPDSD